MRRILILGFGLAAGCASSKTTVTPGASTSAATSQTAAPTRSRNADLITTAEITEATGVTNAFDLIRRLRPNFLRTTERSSMRSNSSLPLVRLDGQVLGEIAELKTVEIGVIQEIRYYSIVEAESRWSGDRGRPVIAVTSKKVGK